MNPFSLCPRGGKERTDYVFARLQLMMTVSMTLSFALLGSSNMGISLERVTTGLQRLQLLLLLIHVMERQGRAPSTFSSGGCHLDLANSQKGWLDPLTPADTLLTCFRCCSGKTSSTGLNLCNTHF